MRFRLLKELISEPPILVTDMPEPHVSLNVEHQSILTPDMTVLFGVIDKRIGDAILFADCHTTHTTIDGIQQTHSTQTIKSIRLNDNLAIGVGGSGHYISHLYSDLYGESEWAKRDHVVVANNIDQAGLIRPEWSFNDARERINDFFVLLKLARFVNIIRCKKAKHSLTVILTGLLNSLPAMSIWRVGTGIRSKHNDKRIYGSIPIHREDSALNERIEGMLRFSDLSYTRKVQNVLNDISLHDDLNGPVTAYGTMRRLSNNFKLERVDALET